MNIFSFKKGDSDDEEEEDEEEDEEHPKGLLQQMKSPDLPAGGSLKIGKKKHFFPSTL